MMLRRTKNITATNITSIAQLAGHTPLERALVCISPTICAVSGGKATQSIKKRRKEKTNLTIVASALWDFS